MRNCDFPPICEFTTGYCLQNVKIIREASRIGFKNVNDATILGLATRLQLDSGINSASMTIVIY